ncbi:MAG: efflux RND transporter permease subunit [Reyranellaceae bacterium]
MCNTASFVAICMRGLVAAATGLVLGGGVAWSQSDDARVFRIAEPFLPRAGTDQKGPFAWPESLKEDVVQRLSTGVAPLLLTTTTMHGVYSITLQFDAERKADDIKRAIQSVLAAHPDSAGLKVIEMDAGRLSALSIVLSSDTLPRWEVADYAAQHVQSRLAPLLNGVGDVRLCRDMSIALMIHLDPAIWQRMGVKGIDMHGVLGPAIARFGDEAGNAGVTRQGDSYAIALAPGSWRSADLPSFDSKQITLPDGRRIRLRDIARVEIGPQPTFDFCLYKGERAVIVQVELRWHAELAATLTRLGQEVQAISRDRPAPIGLTVVATPTTRSR